LHSLLKEVLFYTEGGRERALWTPGNRVRLRDSHLWCQHPPILLDL